MMGKGLLSAVLEGHSDSNTSASGPRGEQSTHTSPASQSISTKGSNTVASHHSNNNNNTGSVGSHPSNSGPPAYASKVRGKCLTSPPEPLSNDGHDNIDGNLIVHENDMLVVPRKGIHTLNPKQSRRKHEFRVQSLLGQGTFAQVFQCQLLATGEVVAVKIVKNKPAYTRQATIEIDVFRALQQQEEQQQQRGSNKSTTSSGASTGGASNASGGSNGTTSTAGDYMVNLMCYFMHKSHLCLVFELLGLNLYEILKRRTFRGLPLTYVRSIVHQSVEGIRELSKKSIVHCDLKPENILLVNDDVAREVVNAGEIMDSQRSEGGTPKTQSVSTTQGSIEGSTKSRGDHSSEGSSVRNNSASVSSSHLNNSSGSSSNAATIQAGNTGPIASKFWTEKGVKLIDFGSACFEGYTSHTYIQSRFYRSPEVLVGLPYDSAIDMWSLGCVAAELFLGLPILPGVHEHDQLGRITEMIAKVPDWMLDQGSKSTKYYIKFVSRKAGTPQPKGDVENASQSSNSIKTPSPKAGNTSTSPSPPQLHWRLKSLQEYVSSLSQNDIRKKGGLAKLEKQPGNRYFRRKRLPDILALHSQSLQGEERDLVPAFIHFLYGLLDPDPWKRWTAFQAMQHPFLTGALNQLRPKTEADVFDPKETNHANLDLDHYWKPPWDPAICRRKLLNVQKMREKQQAMRRNLSRPRSDASARSQRNSAAPGTNMMVQGLQSLNGTGSSPPRQVSSSEHSMESSHQAQGSHMDILSRAAASTSLTNLGNPTGAMVPMAVEAAMGTQENVLGTAILDAHGGARSFNSAGYVSGSGVAIQGDLGNALQRPGVVPGAGGESVQSYGSSTISVGSGSFDLNASAAAPGSLPHAGTNYVQSMPFSSSYASSDRPTQGYQATGLTAGMMPKNPAFPPEPSSAASSVTMEGQGSLLQGYPSNFTDAQQSGMAQQSQMQQTQQFGNQQGGANQTFGVQSQLQQPMLQQQFPGQMQQPQVSQQPFQSQDPSLQLQQAGQLPQQQYQNMAQQPVILAQSNAPGGGFYYVATGANGQPIVLQPVGFLNQQQMGQQGMPQQQLPQQPQAGQFQMVGQQPQQQFMGQQQQLTQQFQQIPDPTQQHLIQQQVPMMGQGQMMAMNPMMQPQQQQFVGQQAPFQHQHHQPQQQHQLPPTPSSRQQQRKASSQHRSKPFGGGTSM
mmetsp:Transcript_25866/g.71193  ORF Transcript_25866/g.71193 Transcript_25866/m.71193 type:complete len:1182 (+) Transcript_25866:3-3548(+)